MANLEKTLYEEARGEKAADQQLERHQKKLVNYYANKGDFRYIYNSDDEGFSEDKVTIGDRQWAVNKLGADPDAFKELDERLLFDIRGPLYSPDGGADLNSCKEVLRELRDARKKRILAYITDGEWDDLSGLSGETLQRFVETYPTPLAFEQESSQFLDMIEQANNPEKRAIYEEAMDGFCQSVYGKKYEYYKAIKALREEAAEYEQKKEAFADKVAEGRARAEQVPHRKKGFFGKLGMLANLITLKEEEPLVRDAGIAMLNKGELIGDPKRPNEDACYFNQEEGVFGVFDGAGGERGAARASNLASSVMMAMVQEKKPQTAEDLVEILTTANDSLLHDKEAGISTGVVGSIIEERGGSKKLIWASVGDSRIYLVRKGEAIQLTQDEGIGNKIWNFLGKKEFSVQHKGTQKLKSGDRIVFCSDGITGDYKEDFIPSYEFTKIVESAESDQMAAEGLMRRATKKDDRTAVVVSI